MKTMKIILAGLGAALLVNVASAGVMGFDDIEYWVGEGEKEAAFVVNWNDGKGEALVWGYRWNGEACGEDMLLAIAKADPRLYYMGVTGTQYGSTNEGMGFNLDGDDVFGVKGKYDPTEVTEPNENGEIDMENAYGSGDDLVGLDEDDHHQSGWYSGYWSYWAADASPYSGAGEWGYSGLGMSTMMLEDGCWQGWGWSDFANWGAGGMGDSAEAVAAVPEPASVMLLSLGCLGLLRRKSS